MILPSWISALEKIELDVKKSGLEKTVYLGRAAGSETTAKAQSPQIIMSHTLQSGVDDDGTTQHKSKKNNF